MILFHGSLKSHRVWDISTMARSMMTHKECRSFSWIIVLGLSTVLILMLKWYFLNKLSCEWGKVQDHEIKNTDQYVTMVTPGDCLALLVCWSWVRGVTEQSSVLLIQSFITLLSSNTEIQYVCSLGDYQRETSIPAKEGLRHLLHKK